MSVAAMTWAFQVRGLSLGERIVLYHLADICNDCHDGYIGEQICWPSLSALCERTEVSRQGLTNMLDALERVGALDVIKDPDFELAKGRGGTRNIYRLHTETAPELVNSVATADFTSQVDGAEVVNSGDLSGQLSTPPYTNRNRNPKLNHKGERDGQSLFALETPSAAQAKPMDVMDAWNQQFRGTKIPGIQKMTDARRKGLATRAAETGLVTLADWRGLFSIMAERPFFFGKNDRGWIADFDFILKPGKIVKILEGGYRGGQKATAGFGDIFDELRNMGAMK